MTVASWLGTSSLLSISLIAFVVGIRATKRQAAKRAIVLDLIEVRQQIRVLLQSEQSDPSRLERLQLQERRLEAEWRPEERRIEAELRREELRLTRKKRLRSEHVQAVHFLLAVAVRLLHPSEHDRYLEEFRAELLDVPRDTRLSHALSLLRGVFVLRLRRGLKKNAADVRRAKD